MSDTAGIVGISSEVSLDGSRKQDVVVDFVQKNCEEVIARFRNPSVNAGVPRSFGVDGDENIVFAVSVDFAVYIASSDCLCSSNWKDGVEGVLHADVVSAAAIGQSVLRAQVTKLKAHENFFL